MNESTTANAKAERPRCFRQPCGRPAVWTFRHSVLGMGRTCEAHRPLVHGVVGACEWVLNEGGV